MRLPSRVVDLARWPVGGATELRAYDSAHLHRSTILRLLQNALAEMWRSEKDGAENPGRLQRAAAAELSAYPVPCLAGALA